MREIRELCSSWGMAVLKSMMGGSWPHWRTQEQLGHSWPGGHSKRGSCVGRWGPAFLGSYAFCSLSGVPGRKPLNNFKQGCDMIRVVFCKLHTGFWVERVDWREGQEKVKMNIGWLICFLPSLTLTTFLISRFSFSLWEKIAQQVWPCCFSILIPLQQ